MRRLLLKRYQLAQAHTTHALGTMPRDVQEQVGCKTGSCKIPECQQHGHTRVLVRRVEWHVERARADRINSVQDLLRREMGGGLLKSDVAFAFELFGE
ncbi:hypothetical protein OH76DRAFT_115364 [Lentinus brumalis]|uniref:Uncharacterized protein n=1 Tax=Lentinus brumalis TaxID=2498619 RepID=A0A371CQ01_9APHY|nr:hypothetical protein OH76DRAFT_115364 [Polyporus brumalis]